MPDHVNCILQSVGQESGAGETTFYRRSTHSFHCLTALHHNFRFRECASGTETRRHWELTRCNSGTGMVHVNEKE